MMEMDVQASLYRTAFLFDPRVFCYKDACDGLGTSFSLTLTAPAPLTRRLRDRQPREEAASQATILLSLPPPPPPSPSSPDERQMTPDDDRLPLWTAKWPANANSLPNMQLLRLDVVK